MECSICLENIEKSKDFTITKCGHTFHNTCLIKHVTISGSSCPYCRCCLETGLPQPDFNDEEYDDLPDLVSDSDSDYEEIPLPLNNNMMDYRMVSNSIDYVIENMLKDAELLNDGYLEDITHIGFRNLFLINEGENYEDESVVEKWYNSISIQEKSTIESLETRYNNVYNEVSKNRKNKLSYEQLLKAYLYMNFPGFNITIDFAKNLKRVNTIITDSLASTLSARPNRRTFHNTII